MTVHTLFLVFSFSIIPAAIIGAIRYHQVTQDNWPFYYVAWIALINEILSEVFTAEFHSTAINNNIYVLIEAMLFCWLFYNWSSVTKLKNKFMLLQLFLCMLWIADNVVFHSIKQVNSMFRVISSYILVFLAIDQINFIIVTERLKLSTNASFLISIGIVIFFTYRAVFESFYWFELPFSGTFYQNVYLIMVYVNLLVNLIFGLAALWIPTRQKFTLHS